MNKRVGILTRMIHSTVARRNKTVWALEFGRIRNRGEGSAMRSKSWLLAVAMGGLMGLSFAASAQDASSGGGGDAGGAAPAAAPADNSAAAPAAAPADQGAAAAAPAASSSAGAS